MRLQITKYMRLMMACCLLCAATGIQAQKKGELPYEDKLIVGKLDNGLTYYIYPNANPKGEAVYRLFVKAGSVLEQENQRGLAHFLEHLAFNGSKHFPDDAMVRFLESKGAKFGKDLNAHTSFNETVYKLQLPSSSAGMVDSTLTIMADWANGLLIEPVQVEKERGVILSEWLSKRSAERESDTALLMELLNGSRYAQRMTIGDTAVIRHCTPQDISDYYHTWYRPSLMAVAVAGDIDAQQIKKLIREKFGSMKEISSPAWKSYPIPTYKKEVAKVLPNASMKSIELEMLQLFPLPRPVQTEADYRDYLMRALVNRLFRIRFSTYAFKNPTYRKASIQQTSFLNATGTLVASAELLPGKVKTGIDEFVAQQQQIFRFGFTQPEIERAKKEISSALKRKVTGNRLPESIDVIDDIYADFYAGNRFTSLQKEYELVERYFPQIDSVELVKELSRLYRPHKMHYLLRGAEVLQKEVGNSEALLMAVKEARRQPVVRYYASAQTGGELCPEPQGGHITRQEDIPAIGAVSIWLDNGVRVIFKPFPQEKGKLLLTGFRKGGLYALDSLQYYNGLFAPSVLSLSGAGHFNRDALTYYLAGKSASMRLLVDKTRTGVAGTSQVAEGETLFRLLYAKWAYPRLDTAVYRQTVEKTKESCRNKQQTASEIFQEQLGWLLNGRNYTNSPLTEEIIDNRVKENEMIPTFNRLYGAADGYTFIILGDCTLEDIKPYIEKYLGGLPKGKSDTAYRFARRPLRTAQNSLIMRAGDSPKASVSLIFQQDSLQGDFKAYTLKSTVMAAMLRTRLLNKLREEMGKVYSVSVASSAGKYPTFLSRTIVGFVCAPQDVDSLIAATQQEVDTLLHQKPAAYESILKDVKSNLLKEYELNRQRSSYWTSCIRNAIFSGEEDWTFIDAYPQWVNALTVEDISVFARHLLEKVPFVKAVLYPKSERENKE